MIRKKECQLELSVVCVLILVNANVAVGVLKLCTHFLVSFKKLNGAHDYVVEIEKILAFQSLGVKSVNLGGLLGFDVISRLAHEIVWSHELVLGTADLVLNRLCRELLFVDIQLFHALRDLALAVVHVTNAEIALITDPVCPSSQNSHTDRVEGTRSDVA